MEWLDAISALWRVLPREQQQGVVMFSASFPLGLVSLLVGLFRPDDLLAGAGAITLALGLLVVLVVGSLIVVLAFRLLRLLLSLPFRLFRRRKPAGGPSEPEMETADTPGRAPADATGWTWFDTLFVVWALLQVFQLYRLFAGS